MKKFKITLALITLLTAAGVSYVNIENQLPTHPLKEYRFRTLNRPLYITLHHSATKGNTLKQIAKYHVEQKGWPGIAYHFAINWKGDVYQLQQLDEITYHNRGHNTESIGIVFVGNFQEKDLPDAAVKSAELLIKGLEESLDIIGVRPHREVPGAHTLCPGDYAYKKLKHLFYTKQLDL